MLLETDSHISLEKRSTSIHSANTEQTGRQEQTLQQLQPKFRWPYLLTISYSIQFSITQLAEFTPSVSPACKWAISIQTSLRQGSEQARDIHTFELSTCRSVGGSGNPEQTQVPDCCQGSQSTNPMTSESHPVGSRIFCVSGKVRSLVRRVEKSWAN